MCVCVCVCVCVCDYVYTKYIYMHLYIIVYKLVSEQSILARLHFFISLKMRFNRLNEMWRKIQILNLMAYSKVDGEGGGASIGWKLL